MACEEGWSYVAEWTGVPLSHVLEAAGIQPRAKYVVYFSIDPDWWDSVDMGDATHPQTFLAYGMNGGDLPAVHGAQPCLGRADVDARAGHDEGLGLFLAHHLELR